MTYRYVNTSAVAPLAFLVVTILLVGAPTVFIPIIGGLALIYGLLWRIGVQSVRDTEEQMELEAIARRADVQHRAALRGDPRGRYGAYPPAVSAGALDDLG